MTFDINKPVQTRDGHSARVICTNKAGVSGEVVVLITDGTPPLGAPNESIYIYDKTGRPTQYSHTGLQLVNIKEPAPPKPAFDPAKPVQTRDGRPARIICTDMKAPTGASIAALVMFADGKERAYGYTSTGEVTANSHVCVNRNDDLVNVPEKRTAYVNIYKDSIGRSYGGLCNTREEADRVASKAPNRIACVPVEYAEGDGL